MVRYQILVFDGVIRKAIVTCVGTVCLFLLAALLVTYSPLLLPHAVPAQVGLLVIVLGTLGSYLWWAMQAKVERLIFSESQYYQRLLKQPAYLARTSRDVTIVAASIQQAVMEAFDPLATCLLILDEEVGCFRSLLSHSGGSEQRNVLEQLFARVTPVAKHGKAVDWLDAAHPLLGRLATAKRPLLLSELCQEQQSDMSLVNIRPGTRAVGSDPLLAAVRVHGRMVGMLVLGPRGDRQAYAGPDFEALESLLSSYGPSLEAARRSALDAHYAALMMKLFQGMPQQTVNQSSLADITHAMAKAIALATASGTEIWLADDEEEEGQQYVRLGVRIGTGPLLLAGDRVALAQLRDGGRVACFASWPGTPDWLGQVPVMKKARIVGASESGVKHDAFPFAWLPLLHGDHMGGVLILTYPRPHVFSLREQHLLQLCVQQYAGLLKQAQIIHHLQAASVQQHEREHRQEQAVLDATTALYRPLSLVEGYVDLLDTSGHLLSPDGQTECLDRAGQAVGDLLLRVNAMIEHHVREQQHRSDANERE